MMKNFNPNAKFRRNGETLLHVCAEYNCRSLFEWLVSDHKAGVFRKNEAGETPFIIAAREGKLDIIKLYIEKYTEYEDYNIDHKMLDGWSAMLYAAMNGFCSIVEYLIKHGANIDNSDRLHRSALHWACRFNNIKMTLLLLK
jgi:ankyrin repeat protein